MLSGILLSFGVLASAALASSAAAVTTVTVNGIASHTVPPLLCELWSHLPVDILWIDIPTFSWTDVRGK
jgi:hypothetical protein